jgi:hypothetical protein
MKEKELYNLRDKILEFDNFKKFKIKVKSFFGKNLEFPMVVGYKSFNPKENWQIKKLSPITNSDRLTIENYFEGLKQVEEEIEERKRFPNPQPIKFNGMIYLNGINSLHYSHWNSHIFSATMHLKKSALYSLDFYYSHRNDKPERIGYAATSKKEETIFDGIMSKFLGPNTQYKR